MFSRKRKGQDDQWLISERQRAENAVQSSADQLEKAETLAQDASQVNRRFRFLRQRNMFAEGFRAIIREARHGD